MDRILSNFERSLPANSEGLSSTVNKGFAVLDANFYKIEGTLGSSIGDVEGFAGEVEGRFS